MSVLFERFISRERNEPPDIDVDFEHQRREEVIQYIYAKYGRERAALTAVVITTAPAARCATWAARWASTWRRSTRWPRSITGGDGSARRGPARARAGLDPDDLRVRQWLELTAQLLGFPRHLSQHVGGFVLTRGRSRAWCRSRTPPCPTHRHPVGQGRPRRAGPAEGRRAGPGHAHRHPPRLALVARARPAWTSACRTSRRGPRHLRHDLRAPTPWACSRSRAARR
jgi:hypothetical protein